MTTNITWKYNVTNTQLYTRVIPNIPKVITQRRLRQTDHLSEFVNYEFMTDLLTSE